MIHILPYSPNFFSILQNISIENHKQFSGNLSYTFKEILNRIKNRNEKPNIRVIFQDKTIIGYFVYQYKSTTSVYINQSALTKSSQNLGLGKEMIKYLKNQTHIKTIVADIKKNNLQSQKCLTKEGFKLKQKENPKYFLAIWKR